MIKNIILMRKLTLCIEQSLLFFMKDFINAPLLHRDDTIKVILLPVSA
jgi:hypothetical protein